MNKYKNSHGRKVLLTAFLSVILGCSAAACGILGAKKADAISSVLTDTTVGEIYNYSDYCYNKDNLDKLATQVLGAIQNSTASRSFNDLVAYAQNTAGKNGVAVKGGSDVTLFYGRYRFTTSASSSYKQLAWMPVYLSSSKTGDAILTLYLASTSNGNGSTSQQEVSYFTNDGNYSVSTSHAFPANMYSTSYIRAVSMGNNGVYTRHNSKGDTTAGYKNYDAKVIESSCNKFNDFIKYYGDGEPEDLNRDILGRTEGLLYPDLATPSEITWQSDECAATYLAGTTYADYCWPNEAYSTPKTGNYYMPGFNYTTKQNYNLWQNDKVWLPSLSEVGNGDIDVQGTDTTNGIWKLTKEQRSNTTLSWLRTAAVDTPRTSNYSTYTMYGLDAAGDVALIDVDKEAGVRPAIHLNLSTIKNGNKTTPPVNLPKTVYGDYCGDFQTIATIPADQKTWYSADDMEEVLFYTDENCSFPTKPMNAGTYYMMVQIKNGSNRYFRGEDVGVKQKSTKFIVRKKAINVKWEYESETELNAKPTNVTIDGEFFNKDIAVGNVPVIGMKYSDITGAGLQGVTEYPDKMGWYKATAYIVDEELHNYNYELVGTDEKPLVSHQFYVDAKKITVPYFVENNSTSLTLGYKGKQFVQIGGIVTKKNGDKYVTINIEARASGANAAQIEENSKAALDKVKDMGLVNGVQTYSVESVADYTFTFNLVDPDNTVWGSEGQDVSAKTLNLTIDRADITVSFNGLPSSWPAAAEITFDLNVIGVYNSEDVKTLDFSVAYYAPGSYSPTIINKNADGKYVIASNTLRACRDGEYYYMYVVMGKSSGYTGNYRMNPTEVTQMFTVHQTVSSFNSSNVLWQYKLNGETAEGSYRYNEHSTENTALELDYVEDGYYDFFLSYNETRLKNEFFVKPEYTGDRTVNDAGMHSLTVKILPYDKNVVFTPQTYTIYFKIKESKFDISNVKWDYTQPYVYSGNEYKVKIDPSTLPEGLSVSYTTGGSAGNGKIDANIYTTKVTFIVSDEYAKNYVTPDQNDPSTYINTGDFDFAQQWEIKKYEIAASWNTENSGGDLFFVPKLATGHNIAKYTYERFDGSSYVACDSITSTGSEQKYRITAAVSDEYSKNYAFTGNTTCEFTVAAGQFAVTVNFEVNGVKKDDGAKFVYNGSAFEVVPKVAAGSVAISSFTVDYYPVVGGVRGSKLTDAPSDAGIYVAVVKTSFSSGGNTFSNESEFNFEVEKADLDLSVLKWEYRHGGKVVTAYFDVDQGKFIDDDGKEAVFAFEYDGTLQEINLVGADLLTGLTLGNINDNSGINAKSYTAHVDFNYDDKNFNEPSFPKTFAWSITQARINFSEVEWGYVDADGAEHKFGSDGTQFTLTRGEDKKAVKYTVALINLPSYVKDMFKYSTTSYTDKDFGTKTGSTCAVAGEYHTEVSIQGTYNDPSGNIKSFSSADFPLNIVKSIDWEIKDRELTVPKDNGTWKTFDNKTHNLLEICGIPEEELNYFNIEIVYVNNNNDIDNDFQGYKGVPYSAFDAGSYIIRFNKLEDEDGETTYGWGQVELEVARGELTVTWDLQGQIPVARVKGVYVSDRLETKYYIILKEATDTTPMELGAAVDVAYIKTTDQARYVAVPTIIAEYENNLTCVMNGEAEKYPFTYIQPRLVDGAPALNKPEMVNSQIEYTGSDINFAIANWVNTYSPYLYIIEGEDVLTQREVGEYHISVSFKIAERVENGKTIKEALAYWSGSTRDDPDLSTFILTFEITPPTKYALAYPLFDKTKAEYTGSAITFTITNWLIIQEYVEYEVFYRGESLGTNLTFTAAGFYTVEFTIPEGSIGYWVNDPDNPKKKYTVQLHISDGDNEILTPVVSDNLKEYTGSELTFTVENWDSECLQFGTLPSGVTADGNRLKVTGVGEYTITVNIIKDGVTFEDGSRTCTLKITVSPSSNPDIEVPISKPAFDKTTATYTGSAIEFRVGSWTIYGNYIEIYSVTPNTNVTFEGGVVRLTDVGTYTIVFKFKDGANAKWQDSGDKADYSITLTVTDSGVTPGDNELTAPSFTKDKLEFTGKEISFTVTDWDSIKDKVTVEVFDSNGNKLEGGLNQKNVGVYTAVFKIKEGANVTFAGGLTEKTLTFEIKQATLSLKVDEDGKPVIKDNKPVIINGDGEEVDYGDYFEPVFRDPTTNEIVPADKLENGKDYNVTFNVKEDKKEEFEKNVTNHTEIVDKLKETYVIKYEQPKSGIPWWVWVIVGGAVLLILIIILIVVLTKRRSDDGDYDDGAYGDYEEEYDDEDEYEDDEEEYDDEDEYDDDEYDDGLDDDEYDDEDF